MRLGLIVLVIVLVVVTLAGIALFAIQGVNVAAVTPPATLAAQNTVAPPSVTSVPQNTASSPTRAGPTATVTLAPDQFRNPVINMDFPDPDILQVGDTYYAYATNSGSTNIQMARSQDLVHWEYLNTALPALPLWAKPQAGLTWAPDVTTGGGETNYVMYFTSRDEVSDKQCIGIATADNPEGPFRATGTANEQAFICQSDQGGSIDPASFTDDDGTRYLLWKNDGNCCGIPTRIYIQQLSPDGLTLQEEPTVLIENDLWWEASLVEAPTLWKQDNKYYLFYSANAYNTERYAVGYAVADSILGPYEKHPEPLLETDMRHGGAFGPGGQDIVLDKDGDSWMVYHSWDPTVSYRAMQIDPLDWQEGMPIVLGPKRTPENVP
jgi:beta-xylosidase